MCLNNNRIPSFLYNNFTDTLGKLQIRRFSFSCVSAMCHTNEGKKKKCFENQHVFHPTANFYHLHKSLSLGEGIRPIQRRGTEGCCGTPSIRQGPGPCFRVQSIEVILKVLLDMSDPVWCLRIWSSELIVTYVKVYEYYHFLKDIFGLSIISSVTNATDQSKIKSCSFCPYRYILGSQSGWSPNKKISWSFGNEMPQIS